MAQGDGGANGPEGRFKFLLLVFKWARNALNRIMMAVERETRLPYWERCTASGAGLVILTLMVVLPTWAYSPNSMLAFADVVGKSPVVTGAPILGLLGIYSHVCASLQKAGAFSEHFMRGFLLPPFLFITLYALITILFLVFTILKLLLLTLGFGG
ncbi:hypothetical protein EJC49_14075 [Aquibium carbonis]|uniref:Uncharacterized protein n=1 Tax=Aquibium carbonis TaxID=2495581 RepID=A0A429YW66_9HYPH|nr:hypothetical protein [Aquibium carbonis]RST85670.1 hypothetical protein EJC49_14075 [Aquibium carbonis]